jgi:hypothetical protein
MPRHALAIGPADCAAMRAGAHEADQHAALGTLGRQRQVVQILSNLLYSLGDLITGGEWTKATIAIGETSDC